MSRTQDATITTPPLTEVGGDDLHDENNHLSVTVEHFDRRQPTQDSANTPGTEGYPSWLPRRPPPPEPASTLHSVAATGHLGRASEDSPEPYVGVGRKPTPRSIRVVRMQDVEALESYGRRIPTDATKVALSPTTGNAPRVWSRATSAGFASMLSGAGHVRVPRPRFRSRALHLELLRNPSWKSRIHFYLLPILTFYHILLQTFFDFNAVFILIQVIRYPNPAAPGVSGSGRNWSLGAAAYIACWAVWIFGIFILYELIYSFARRWRVKRPLMLPLYLSRSGFDLVRMSSFTNFSFFEHIRANAWSPEQGGSVRDGLAELFYRYSQNLPEVALLLPRAGLSLALVLSFWSPIAGNLSLQSSAIRGRDNTFFRDNGALTSYARGVLLANAAWTAWRALVLLVSYIGLWVLSGHGCAGLCGPRYRWEEEDQEKTMSVYSDGGETDPDALPWAWREGATQRVQAAWEFCLTSKPRGGWRRSASVPLGEKEAAAGQRARSTTPGDGFEERVLAAIGLPTVPPPARRGPLSGDLFLEPPQHSQAGLSDIIPPKPSPANSEGHSSKEGPLKKLPYPFPGYGSQDQVGSVPFPPSPEPEEHEDDQTHEEDDDFHENEEASYADESEQPSSSNEKGRSSGSMSSLGRPIASRYPFQFRRPTRGSSITSSFSRVHRTPQSQSTNSRSIPSGVSHTATSMNISISASSHSPESVGSSSAPVSPLASSGSNGVIPMPPGGQGRRRARAGTVPNIQMSPTPVGAGGHARLLPRARTDTESTSAESVASNTFGPVPLELDEDLEVDDGHAENQEQGADDGDGVGLLSNAPSPTNSFTNIRQRTQSALSRHSGRSRSRASSARSRAHSFIQSIGNASRSSVDVVATALTRPRYDSMSRFSDSPSQSSGTDALPSSPENYTFGHPLRVHVTASSSSDEGRGRQHRPPPLPLSPLPSPPAQQQHLEVPGTAQSVDTEDNMPTPGPTATMFPSSLRESESFWSVPSERTARRDGGTPSDEGNEEEPETIRIVGRPIPIRPGLPAGDRSTTDISTANQSFVTAPATVAGGTDSVGGRTPSTIGGVLSQPFPPGPGGRNWGPA